MNALEQLRRCTTVVADTGDVDQIARFAPQDATTNPSLVLKAAQSPRDQPLLQGVVTAHPDASPAEVAERLLVAFGVEILKRVPGRVSTEIDPRLSHDSAASVDAALRLVALYDAAQVPRHRVLIKLAATWDGIQAARALAAQGVRSNLTLLFCLAQARACADAGVQLISPFVGRIYDWHKQAAGAAWDEAAHAGPADPGVRSVREIHAWYQRHGVRTEVMAASFRNMGQITALAGCDLMTISPALLAELQGGTGPVTRQLMPPDAPAQPMPPPLSRAEFEAALAADAMASQKLDEGIRQFVADTEALEALIRAQQARP